MRAQRQLNTSLMKFRFAVILLMHRSLALTLTAASCRIISRYFSFSFAKI